MVKRKFREVVTRPAPRDLDRIERDIDAVKARLAEPKLPDAVRASNRQRLKLLQDELSERRLLTTA